MTSQVISEINGRIVRLREIQAQLGKLASDDAAGSGIHSSLGGASSGHAHDAHAAALPLVELSFKAEEMPEDREKVGAA